MEKFKLEPSGTAMFSVQAVHKWFVESMIYRENKTIISENPNFYQTPVLFAKTEVGKLLKSVKVSENILKMGVWKDSNILLVAYLETVTPNECTLQGAKQSATNSEWHRQIRQK